VPEKSLSASGLLITRNTYASWRSSERAPTPSSGWPNPQTRSPSTYVTVPIALAAMSPDA
jgi:hypothetical protein